jgi:hypothetical protein
MGPDVARLRLFFLLPRPADNFALYNWADELSRTRPDLRLDPSVMQAMQPIYTARPISAVCPTRSLSGAGCGCWMVMRIT